MSTTLTNALREFIIANEGDALKVMKHKLYDAALVETRGNSSAAAKLLGIGRSTMDNYINGRVYKR